MKSELSSIATRRILRKLGGSIRKEFLLNNRCLRNHYGNPKEVHVLTNALLYLSEIANWTQESQVKESSPAEIVRGLDLFSRQLATRILEAPGAFSAERRILSSALELLNSCQETLLKCIGETSGDGAQKAVILIPTDLLYQAYHSLFPPERMLVIAGRKGGNRIRLGASFEITGASSTGHVRANPNSLAAALISMTVSDSHLAAWFHSHPGEGRTSTFPSSTDQRQHLDWLVDYSPLLLSGIFVQDGFIRFWGTALDNDQVILDFEGGGIHKEHDDGTLYKLVL